MTFPPIETVKDEMDARGISLKEMAKRLDLKPSDLNRMFKTGAAITVPFAQKLEVALGISADVWLTMQANHERDKIAIAQRNDNESEGMHKRLLMV